MNSLRQRLTGSLVLVFTLLLCGGLTAVGWGVYRFVVGAFDAALLARGQSISALTEIENGRTEFDFPEDFLRQYTGPTPEFFFEIWNEDSVLVRSPALEGADLSLFGHGDQTQSEIVDMDLPNGRPGRAISYRYSLSSPDGQVPDPPPVFRLILAADRGELDKTLHGLLAVVATCGGLMIAVIFFLVPPILRRGLVPLARFGERASEIDAGTLSTRFSILDLPQELRPIADRLNSLLTRLEASFERERRFSADLAHELRTPLAELRSQVEAAIKWPDSRSPLMDHETLEIAVQMEAIVSSLLAIARSEEGLLTVSSESVSVDELVRESWKAVSFRAAACEHIPEFKLATVRMETDKTLFGLVVGNLFDNCVDYAPTGSVIRVDLDETGELEISNRAPDLDSEDVAHLFDRFWRKEAARHDGRHTGLGLSVARLSAQAIDWCLSARYDNGWLVFSLKPGTAIALNRDARVVKVDSDPQNAQSMIDKPTRVQLSPSQ